MNKLFLYSAIYKPSVTILHTVKKFCILPSQCICVFLVIVAVNTDSKYGIHLLVVLKEMMPCEIGNEYIYRVSQEE